MVELLQHAQSSGMLGLAASMTSQRMVRIDEPSRPGRFSLDRASQVLDLKALGENSARQAAEKVARQFFTIPVEKFVPFHSDSDGVSQKLQQSA